MILKIEIELFGTVRREQMHVACCAVDALMKQTKEPLFDGCSTPWGSVKSFSLDEQRPMEVDDGK